MHLITVKMCYLTESQTSIEQKLQVRKLPRHIFQSSRKQFRFSATEPEEIENATSFPVYSI